MSFILQTLANIFASSDNGGFFCCFFYLFAETLDYNTPTVDAPQVVDSKQSFRANRLE